MNVNVLKVSCTCRAGDCQRSLHMISTAKRNRVVVSLVDGTTTPSNIVLDKEGAEFVGRWLLGMPTTVAIVHRKKRKSKEVMPWQMD